MAAVASVAHHLIVGGTTTSRRSGRHNPAGATTAESGSAHALDQWVDGIRRGSNEAYTAVYDATAAHLLSYAHAMLRNRATAEDIVQQAFLELVQSSAAFRGKGEALRVWLFKAVRFRCLDHIRRASSKEVPSTDLPERMIEQDPLAEMIDPRLAAALGRLSERQRSMVLMRHVVGLSGAEIAQVVGLNRPAVYAVIKRAESRLRESMGSKEVSS